MNNKQRYMNEQCTMNNVQWRKVKLGNIGNFYVGGDIDKNCFSPYPTIECRFPIYANALVNEGLYGYSSTYEFDKEAVTITGRGDVGKVFYRKPYFSTIIRLVTLIPIDSNIDVKFLSYAMSRINFIIESTGVPQLTAPQTKKYEVSIPYKNDKPDLAAQRRIAAILSSADKVIDSTQRLIEKYKKMKQGMMEELLNEQCTMNNVQWRKVRLGECLKQKPDYGINAPAVPYDNHLPTYLRITDITEDGYYSKKDIVSVASQDALKYVMEKGDLVFARTGASTGKTYLYDPKDGMLVFAGFLIRVRTDENVLLPEFFKYQTQTPQYKNWIAANSMRTGQPGINGNEYEAYPVSIPYKNDKPDLPEQRRIASILSGIDAKIAAEEKVLDKYIQIKKGLMERLLNEQCTMNNER